MDPGGLSDNIFRSMLPGQIYDIVIPIPSDHTRGTYWYHPHHHGSADIQLTGGMAGVVIIEGDFDDIPEVMAAEERVLVLNEVPMILSGRRRYRGFSQSTVSASRPFGCAQARSSAGGSSMLGTRTT